MRQHTAQPERRLEGQGREGGTAMAAKDNQDTSCWGKAVPKQAVLGELARNHQGSQDRGKSMLHYQGIDFQDTARLFGPDCKWPGSHCRSNPGMTPLKALSPAVFPVQVHWSMASWGHCPSTPAAYRTCYHTLALSYYLPRHFPRKARAYPLHRSTKNATTQQ